MRRIRQFFMTAAVLLIGQNLLAYNFEVDGIYYNITSDENLTVEVTYETTDYNSYSGNVVIPPTVYWSGNPSYCLLEWYDLLGNFDWRKSVLLLRFS